MKVWMIVGTRNGQRDVARNIVGKDRNDAIRNAKFAGFRTVESAIKISG